MREHPLFHPPLYRATPPPQGEIIFKYFLHECFVSLKETWRDGKPLSLILEEVAF